MSEMVVEKGTDTNQREIRPRRIGNMKAECNERMKQATEMDAYNEDGGVDMETRCRGFVYIL